MEWSFTLEHLIGGTTGPVSGKYVAGFGDFFVDKIETRDVELSKEQLAELVAVGEVPAFMAKLREVFPQHFAMAYLGLITGCARPRCARFVEAPPSTTWTGRSTGCASVDPTPTATR